MFTMKFCLVLLLILFIVSSVFAQPRELFTYKYKTGEKLKYHNRIVADIKAAIIKKNIIVDLNYEFSVMKVDTKSISFKNKISGTTNQPKPIKNSSCEVTIDNLGKVTAFKASQSDVYVRNFKNFFVNFPEKGLSVGESFIRTLVFSFPSEDEGKDSFIKCRGKMTLENIQMKGKDKLAFFNVTLVDYTVQNVPGKIKKVTIKGSAIFNLTSGRFVREKYHGDIVAKKGFITAKIKLSMDTELKK